MFKRMLTKEQKEYLGNYDHVFETDDYNQEFIGIITDNNRRYIVSNIRHYDSISSNRIIEAFKIVVDKINEDMNAKK